MIEVRMDESGAVAVTGDARIHEIEALQEALLSLSGNRGAVLDLSGLASLDTAGAQVLMAFRRSAAVRKVVPPNETISERLRRSGLHALLGS